jgi:hypothetical protein
VHGAHLVSGFASRWTKFTRTPAVCVKALRFRLRFRQRMLYLQTWTRHKPSPHK